MYLIDTNILITAKNSYYPFDFCSGFWAFVQDKLVGNDINLISSVQREILAHDDEIANWVLNLNPTVLDDTAAEVQAIFSGIANDVMQGRISPSFSQSEKDRFLSGADPLLIATAKHLNYTIVTNEKAVPHNSSKIKMPNVCDYYDVRYITPFEMLRQLGINLCHNRAP